MTEFIGLIAAFLTTLSFLPQAILVLRTGDTRSISLAMYLMFTTGVAAWLIYGIMIASVPVIAANFITLLLATLILAVKVRAVMAKRALNAVRMA